MQQSRRCTVCTACLKYSKLLVKFNFETPCKIVTFSYLAGYFVYIILLYILYTVSKNIQFGWGWGWELIDLILLQRMSSAQVHPTK